MNRSIDGSPCVLFVDDEEMTRKTFERIASQEFPVLLAGDVPEAIEVLKARGDDIGVLLTDQRMPGGLGVELLEYARDANPNIVRMLTTAYSELEDAIAAVNRGEIIRYIEKPWSNIDALLIDLRVAMRFHLLERSNQDLMAEKMSAKARGARLERLQVLAALASAQPDSKAALISLEAMLRSLSELRTLGGVGETESGPPEKLYSGPAEEAGNAILLGERVAQVTSARQGNNWAEVCEFELLGDASNQEIPILLRDSAAELLSRASALLAGKDKSSGVIAAISADSGVIELSVSKASERSDLLNRWVNLGSEPNSINAVADLLKLYFIAFSAGATVDLGFDNDKALSQINISFSDLENGLTFPAQDSDWLEDIVILFT